MAELRPVIGITTYLVPASWGAWNEEAALVPADYVRAVSAGRAARRCCSAAGASLAETLDASTGSSSPVARISTLSCTPRRLIRDGGVVGSGTTSSGADARGARAGRADARDLPRLAGVERRARRRPGSSTCLTVVGDGAASRGPPGVFSEHDVSVVGGPGWRRSLVIATSKSHHHQGFGASALGLPTPRAPGTGPWKRWMTRRAASPWASCGTPKPAKTERCSRRWSARPRRSGLRGVNRRRNEGVKTVTKHAHTAGDGTPARSLERCHFGHRLIHKGLTMSGPEELTGARSSARRVSINSSLSSTNARPRSTAGKRRLDAQKNHHHFVVELTRGGPSEGMRELHGGYSRRIHAA